jgi:hypothetical protein
MSGKVCSVVDGNDEVFVSILQRILTRASGSVSDFSDGVLLELVAAHSVERGQLRSLWEQILLVCTDDALEQESSGADLGASFGEAAADSGFSLSSSLQVLQELRHLAMECVRQEASIAGYQERFVISSFTRIADSLSTFMLQFSRGYFRAEVANQSRLRSQQDAFVWSVLSGASTESGASSQLGLYGLDKSAVYWAFRARVHADEDFAEVEASLGGVAVGTHRQGAWTVIDGEVCGFFTVLPELARQTCGVAGPVPFTALPAAFARATRAMHIAVLAELTGAHSLESHGILAPVLTDRDIATELQRKYLEPLIALGAYGEELFVTLRSYIDNVNKADATAKFLGIHVNSVRYRLGKIEAMFDISLRDTRTVVELWWAFQLPPYRRWNEDDVRAKSLTEGLVHA